jgi:DNA-directed RNA polymerase subunit M/transcription elongation factor TFIIS
MNSKFIEKRVEALGMTLEDVASMPAYSRVAMNLPPIIPQVDYTPVQQFAENYLPRWKSLRKLFNLDIQIDIDPPFSLNEPDFGRNFSWYQDKMNMQLADRNTLYQTVDEMDNYDIIASALDLLAEDATQIDPDTNRSVWVESENEEIRNTCMELFDRVGLEEQIFGMVRGMCKYGDNFERIIASSDLGIVALENVHPSRLTRVQDRFGRLLGFVPGMHNELEMQDPDKANKLNISKPWSFLHFRLISSRREIKHGESYLINANKVFRQLKILEDTMVLYRLNRASDKDVYYIDVGDQPPDQQWQTINQWRRELRKKFYVNPATGQARQQYNPRTADEDLYFPLPKGSESRVERLQGAGPIGDIYDIEHFRDKLFGALRISKAHLGFEKDLNAKCFSLDTKIPCLDGVTRTLREIIETYEQTGELPYVYSYDLESNKVTAGKVTWAGVTRRNTEVVRVTLDNGNQEICTPDHLWLLKDGTYKQAQHLYIGDSLRNVVDEFEITVGNIEFLEEPIDTGDITVDIYHNFAVDSGVFVHNSTLASQDIRFARTVKRVQRATIYAITQLCRIHLSILGYDVFDLKNKFKVKMASVTYLDELAKSESWELKQRIADSLLDYATKIRDLDPENNTFRMEPWLRYIMRKFFGFSTEEINMFMGPPTGSDMTGVPPSIQNFGETIKEDMADQRKKARRAIREASTEVFVEEPVPPVKPSEEDLGALYDLKEEERKLYGEHTLNCPVCLQKKESIPLERIDDKDTKETYYLCNSCKFVASPDE